LGQGSLSCCLDLSKSQKEKAMTHKMTIITGTDGKLIGAMRMDTIQDGKNTVQFHLLPQPGHKHHEVEVDEELMHLPVDEIHKALLNKISAKS
jgi:hypothetical protein